jgi:hypothetical protein
LKYRHIETITALLTALLLGACADYANPAAPCVPNAARACACDGGGDGWQVCSGGGEWLACVCDPEGALPPPRTGTARLRVEPAWLDFSDTVAGTTARREVELTNDGDLAAALSLELIEDLKPEDQRRELSWDADAPPDQRLTLEPGQRLRLALRYTPQDTNPDTGRLHVREHSGDQTETFTVNILADGSLQDIDAPRRMIFGRAPVGRELSEDALIQNVGGAALTLTRAQLADADDFSLCLRAPDQERFDCGDDALASPLQLLPGQSALARVTWRPRQRGDAQGWLLIHSNDPDEHVTAIQLLGGATEPCLELLSGDGGVDFGEVPVGSTGRSAIRVRNCSLRQELVIGALRVSGDAAFSAPARPAPPLALAPGQEQELPVHFSPTRAALAEGMLEIVSNDPQNSPLLLPLRGVGVPVDNCAVAIGRAMLESQPGVWSDDLVAPPLDTLRLDASESFDPDLPGVEGAISRYEWTVTQRPDGSTSPLEPLEPSGAIQSLFLDLVGVYRLQLQVFDAEGRRGCAPVNLTARVVADEDIHVQLVWSTPGDRDQTDFNGTDLDLHFLHPNGAWNNPPWDCYWSNTEPDWGVQNRGDDNPSLDIDDTDGAGPENINLDNPEAVPYRVGAYYFNAGGFGRSEVTVRVYLGGALAFEALDRVMTDGQFWDVATIDWARVRVVAVDELRRGFP